MFGVRKRILDFDPKGHRLHANASFETLRFDDLAPGQVYPLGRHEMTREAVIAFASLYDPQPFHLDEAAAIDHPLFDRMSASGWHSVMVMNCQISEFWQGTRVVGLAGGGVEAIRWIEPVYPGDVLTGRMEIVTARASASRPERGVLTMRATLANQAGRDVATLTITGIFRRD